MSAITDKDPTTALRESCQVQSKIAIELTPLFMNDQVNPVAKEAIGQAIQAVRFTNPTKPSAYLFSQLTKDQLEEFFAEMKKLPESEQCFKTLQHTPSFPHLNALLSRTGLNGFYMCNGGEMVPSFGMMQTLLKVKYGIEPKLDPAYITTPQDTSKAPLNRPLMARLQLAYAMLCASKADPEMELRKLLATSPFTPEMRHELQIALRQMPNDPFLNLLFKLTAAKL